MLTCLLVATLQESSPQGSETLEAPPAPAEARSDDYHNVVLEPQRNARGLTPEEELERKRAKEERKRLKRERREQRRRGENNSCAGFL